MESRTEQVLFEDDAGYLHTLDVESKNEDNRTVTGIVTVHRNGHPERQRVTVPDWKIQHFRP